MASLVSGEASAQAHLHLDPSLQIPVKNSCEDCLPGGNLLFRLFCCAACFRSNCCNTTLELDDHAIYCHEDGRCEIFDSTKTDDTRETFKVSAERVKRLVEREKRLSRIQAETGIDLESKVKERHPITIRELKRMQTL
jgi:hypothetical protein